MYTGRLAISGAVIKCRMARDRCPRRVGGAVIKCKDGSRSEERSSLVGWLVIGVPVGWLVERSSGVGWLVISVLVEQSSSVGWLMISVRTVG